MGPRRTRASASTKQPGGPTTPAMASREGDLSHLSQSNKSNKSLLISLLLDLLPIILTVPAVKHIAVTSAKPAAS